MWRDRFNLGQALSASHHPAEVVDCVVIANVLLVVNDDYGTAFAACSSTATACAGGERAETPGRKPRVVPEALAEKVRAVAREYPWWGYKRIAVVVRRAGDEVSNKQVYKVLPPA